MGNTLFTHNGIIRFYDGTIIAIESQEYSPDGIHFWEKTFNPEPHISTIDGVTLIEGHKYKRVKHSGDTEWQLPYKIVAETPEFQVNDLILQWKFEDEEEWKDLINLEELKGDKGDTGEKGIPGEGFHIDIYGYFADRPDCSNQLDNSNCNTCNDTANTTNNAVTYLSLGDGELILTADIISNGSVVVGGNTFTHFSNNLTGWTSISNGIVGLRARYLATDATGAVYTDMRDENFYGSRGIVYVCADGKWIVLTNIATPSYMVGETLGSDNIGYLDHFTTTGTGLDNTITLENGILKVIEQSLDENALQQSIVSDGLLIPNPGDKIQVNVSDFAGFGLQSYTSNTDGFDNLQVLVDSLINDGLAVFGEVSIDGETRNTAIVNVNDLINQNSFLISNTETDNFDDLYVNIGNGLMSDGGNPAAITIRTDELSLTVDATNLRVMPYDNNAAQGIKREHLNPDFVRPNYGLEFDTNLGLFARVDTQEFTIGINGVGELYIPDNAIIGSKLNDNVADNTRGIEVLNDMLSVKVDGITIDYNGSGELEVLPTSLQMVTSILPFDNGSQLDAVRDDVQLHINEGEGIETVFTSDGSANILTLNIAFDTAWGDARYQPIGTSTTVYWNDLARTNSDPTTIEQYISGLNHLIENNLYGNMKVVNGTGLIIVASSGEQYRLIVDANGNLDTELYTN